MIPTLRKHLTLVVLLFLLVGATVLIITAVNANTRALFQQNAASAATDPTAAAAENVGGLEPQVAAEGKEQGFIETGGVIPAWQIAIMGAVIGAILTVVVDRFIEKKQEDRALNNHLNIVKSEIISNSNESSIRSKRQSTDPFPFHTPLPTTSWEGLCSSGIAWKMLGKPALFTEINNFYSNITTANHYNKVAATVFGYSQQEKIPSEDRAVYLDKAMSMAISPYKDIASQGNLLVEMLDRKKSA